MKNLNKINEEIENSYIRYYYLAKSHVLLRKIRSVLVDKSEENICYLDRCLTKNQEQRDGILGNNEDLAKSFLILAHEDKEIANYELYYKLNPQTVCQEEEEEKCYFKTQKKPEELSDQIEAYDVIIDNSVNILTNNLSQKSFDESFI